jgi:hypothetical protein
MPLLLTVLSVLALWALLGVLVFGLLFVIKALQGIRTRLEKIAMGVRAIEHQVRPLGRHAETLAARLERTGAAFSGVAAGFREADGRLERAAPRLRPR